MAGLKPLVTKRGPKGARVEIEVGLTGEVEHARWGQGLAAVTLLASHRGRLVVRSKGKATGTARERRVRLEPIGPGTVAFMAEPGITYRLSFAR